MIYFSSESVSPDRLDGEQHRTLREFREDCKRRGLILAETGNPRSEARWKAAVDELVAQELLESRGHNDEVFGMTNTGHEVADRLRQQV